MLGLNMKDFNNDSIVDQFINNIVSDFHHMLITEYLDESLIVMRRKLCWDISDIFYISRTVRTYTYKTKPLQGLLRQKLTQWNEIDVKLYELFNQTLWKNIAQYGEDFWQEVEFFKSQRDRTLAFCPPVLNHTNAYFNISHLRENILIPASSWGREVKIDNTWCLVNQIAGLIFKNIFRINQYPELCKANLMNTSLRTFFISKKNFTVKLNSKYCSKSRTSSKHYFQLPLPILMDKDAYWYL